jgi:hypothetical protein
MSVCMCPDLQYLTVVRISVVAGAVDLSSVPRFSGEASSDHSWTFYTVKDSHLGAAWSSSGGETGPWHGAQHHRRLEASKVETGEGYWRSPLPRDSVPDVVRRMPQRSFVLYCFNFGVWKSRERYLVF